MGTCNRCFGGCKCGSLVLKSELLCGFGCVGIVSVVMHMEGMVLLQL